MIYNVMISLAAMPFHHKIEKYGTPDDVKRDCENFPTENRFIYMHPKKFVGLFDGIVIEAIKTFPRRISFGVHM